MNLEEARRALPELEGLDDDQAVDALHAAYYPDMDRGAVASALGLKITKPPRAAAPPAGFIRTAADFGITAVKGTIGATEAVVGAADLVSGGAAGKALEQVGYRPKEAKAILDEGYSDSQRRSFEDVRDAEGLWDTFKAAARNPSVVAHSVVESLPSMALGGLGGRAIMGVAPKVGAVAAGALGEGMVMAGGAAEHIRQETPDGLLTGEQGGLAVATGAAGTLFGMLGAKVAKRLGVMDVDSMLAGAAANPKAAKGIVRMTLEGAAAEGILEELPQSVSEQVLQNLALGKPIDEGVNQAAVLGTLAGAAMGGGVNAYGMMRQPQKQPDAKDILDAPSVDAALETAQAALKKPGVAVGERSIDLDEARSVGEVIATNAPAVAPTLTGTDPAALMGQPPMMGDSPNDALLAGGRNAVWNQERDAEADTIVDRMHRETQGEAQGVREWDRSKPLPDLDVAIQPGDILAPSGGLFTEKAAKLKARAVGGMPVAVNGGWIVRPQAKGATSEKNPSNDGGTGIVATPTNPAGSGLAIARQPDAPTTAAATGPAGLPAGGSAAPGDVAQHGGADGLDGAAQGLPAAPDRGAGARADEAQGGDGAVQGSLPVGRHPGAEQPAVEPGWKPFPKELRSIGIPRADMPQIKAEHRGAMVNFLNARGIAHEEDNVDPATLRPTQAEYSPEKVTAARDWAGETDRAILVSADGRILDGHHQWIQALGGREGPIRVIRLKAPITQLLKTVKEFPSATTDDASAPAAPDSSAAPSGQAQADERGDDGANRADGVPAADAPAPDVAEQFPEAAAAWTRMREVERAALLGRSAVKKQKIIDRVARTAWADLEPGWKKTIARLLESVSREAAAATGGQPESSTGAASEAKSPDESKTVPREQTAAGEPGAADSPAGGRDSEQPLTQAAQATEAAKADDAVAEAKPARRVYNKDGSYYTEPAETVYRGYAAAGRALEEAGEETHEIVRVAKGLVVRPKAAAPTVSANTIFTDDAAAKAREILRKKLATPMSGIDPELMQAGITLAGWHVEHGARKFGAFAKAMLDDMGEAIRPYLKGWYLAVRYDPRAAGFAGEMSSAGFVDEFDIAAVAAPSDMQEPVKGDTGEQDGTATRDLDRTGESAPGGAPTGSVRAPAEGGQAGAAPDRGGRGDQQGAGDAAGAGPAVSGSVGAGASDAVPAARGGRRARDAGDRGVQGAPRADAGPGLFDDAGREGTAGVAPNAAPAPAPQFTLDDFTIEDDFALGEGGQKAKFRANIEAIKLAKELMADEGRVATPEEQKTLARYVGWGGLAPAFDAGNRDWSREFAELKTLLTEEEYDAARRSTRYAHYTSREIIQDGVYAAMRRFGFTGGRVLEPGTGVGNFIGLMPRDMRSAGRVTGVEREPIAVTIAKHLYPLQNIQRADFTEFKGNDAFYDAVVGNPPFAADPQTDASGRKHLSGLSLHNYFFAKSVDMLREGGILAQVVTNSFLDSAGDKARRYISDRTKLLGAIRLPNNAFSKNAGTDVTTDIIFLQKRPESEWGGRAARAEAKTWMDAKPFTDRGGSKVNLNQYFHDNPEMMLGEWGMYGTMYGGRKSGALVAAPGQDTAALLKEAVARLPEAVYQNVADIGTDNAVGAAVQALRNPPVQEGGYFIEDGKLLQRLPDIAGEARGVEITADTQWGEKTKLGEAGADKIRRLADMRTTVRALLAAELAGDANMEALRKTLNEQYDAFTEKHHLIGDRGTYRVFDDDPDFPLLLSLEQDYTPGIGLAEAKKLGVKVTKSKAKKSAIFTQRVVDARKTVQKVETAEDALNVSMAERGRLDTAYIAQLLGKPADEVLREMTSGNKPLLFLDPATDEYVLRDAYLSGNVRQKLQQAKQAGMQGNVSALMDVQPEDVPAHEIGAKIGAPWVPTQVYEEFAKDLFGEGTEASVRYEKLNSSYAAYISPGSEVNDSNKWGIPKYPGRELLSALLNNRTIKVQYKDKEGVHTDTEATEMANVKAQDIRDRFSDWLFADPDRSEMLVRAYNDTNNNYVTRQFDGSWMTFPGKVPDSIIKFRRHQRNAIARTVQERTVLLDHVVGAGKTFTIVAAAMELRRTGLARKPMITVPNHLVKQWAADFYRLYPGAKILTATKKDFEKVNRRRFLAKIATGDWDAVVIAHSSYGFIQPGAKFEAEFNAKQVELIEAAISDVETDPDANEQQKKRTVKQLEGMKERLENRIKRLRDKPMDDLLDFEQLGVDQLAVDEAHLFKNLMYTTKLQGVAGLGDPAGAKRAYDMYVKTQEVMEKNGRGQGVVFATGTPVSNSLAEKYHMMRYLMPRQMEELGFQSFDAWANTYAEVTQVWMQRPSGDGFKAQNRMSTFTNVHELLKLFDQVADTVTNQDIKKAYKEENNGAEYPLPPLKTGRRIPVSLDKSPAQEAYMQQLAARAKILEARKGPPKKGDDNILVLMTDARKAAMDIRLVDVDRTEREPGGRIDVVADNIIERYRKYAEHKGTQLMFSDLGTPKKHAQGEMKEFHALQGIIAEATDEVRDRAALGDERAQEIVNAAEDAETELDEKGPDWMTAVKAALRGFSVYDDLKDALIERGIPEHEIAFIHDYNTDEQKAALFRKVNAGDIRVLMGSTQKMGAGTNVQQRLVALHHMDVPWRPSDVEQREGRIERQGNILYDNPANQSTVIPGFEVEVLAYVTKDTLDMRMWQIQEVKLKVINQLRTRQIERNMDNAFEDAEMSASEMQAAATGNMDLLLEIQARNDIKTLERKRRSFDAQKNDLLSRRKRNAANLKELPKQIEVAQEMQALAAQYERELQESTSAVKITIDGKEYTDPKEAGAVLLRMMDAKFFTRTVEKDGKKVREELSAEAYGVLSDKLAAMREAGKTDDDKELQATLFEYGSWEERAAPLDVELNGERYTARAKLTEAYRNIVGDHDPFLLKVGDKTYNRRTAAATAVRQQVTDAIADEKEAVLGQFGPFTLTVEGQPTKAGKGDVWHDLDVTLRVGKDGRYVADAQMQFDAKKALEGLAVAEKVLDWASSRAQRAGSDVSWLEANLQAAKKAQKELDAADDLGEWPDQDKLEAARTKHKEILARLGGKGPKGEPPGSGGGGGLQAQDSGRDSAGDLAVYNMANSGKGARSILQHIAEKSTVPFNRDLAETLLRAGINPTVSTDLGKRNGLRNVNGLAPAALYEPGDDTAYLFTPRSAERHALHEFTHAATEHALRAKTPASLRMRALFDHVKAEGSVGTQYGMTSVSEFVAEAFTNGDFQEALRGVSAPTARMKNAWDWFVSVVRQILGLPQMQTTALEDALRIGLDLMRENTATLGGAALASSQGAAFYSALAKGIEAHQSRSLPVAGWQGAISAMVNKGTIKADEVEWSGLREWLDMQRGKVDKAAVLDFLAANGVRVEEVTHGGASSSTRQQDLDDIRVQFDALGWTINEDELEYGNVQVERKEDGEIFAYTVESDTLAHIDNESQRIRKPQVLELVRRLYSEHAEYSEDADEDMGATPIGTRYGKYTLPGGENYREVLLTLPVKDDRRPASEADEFVLEDMVPAAEFARQQGNYHSNHWDEPNIIAHIRLNDRTDADGKRVLFVEEIQSDWAQEGRRKGFDTGATAPAGWADTGNARGTGNIPRAPFVDKTDAWLALVLKRIIHMAATEGYDRVAFVTGKQSADRYSLSKQVDRVEYTRDFGGALYAYRDGRRIIEKNDVSEEQVADLIGKDAAKRLLESEEKSGLFGKVRVLQGVDLEVGGEGMIAFYDKIVPAAANKLLAKLGGGKLTTVNMKHANQRGSFEAADDANEDGISESDTPPTFVPGADVALQQPGFDVTDAMRETASKGLPLFAKGFNTREIQVDGKWRPIDDSKGRLLGRDFKEQTSFWKWAGDTKVVDAEGKPLVVYHGTNKDFSEFDRLWTVKNLGRRIGPDSMGSWFSTNPSQDGGAGMYGDTIMPVYLSIKNPVEWTFAELMEALDDKLPKGAKHKPGIAEVEALREELAYYKYDGIKITHDKARERESTEFLKQDAWVVLEPTQIKSATGNTGAYDASNPDILFASDDAAVNDPRDYKQLVRGALQEIHSSPGKIHWWHKTLGTQYNLAQRSQPFRRVFERVQDFLNDVSLYATEAADKAPTILPKLETWRDIAKQAIDPKDAKALSAPVFEGTLLWTRDAGGNAIKVADLEKRSSRLTADQKADEMVRRGMLQPGVLKMWEGSPDFEKMVDTRYANTVLKAGIVFTRRELETIFKLDKRLQDLYFEFRAATDESLTRLALSDMVRLAGADADFVRDAVMGAKSVTEGAEMLRDQLLQLANEQPKRKGTLTDTATKVMDKAARAVELMAKGYAPLSRFGHYTVTVRDPDGEVLYFGMYESRFDAARAAAAMAKDEEFAGAKITRGTMSEEEYKLFAGVSPETVELFGEMLGLESTGDSAADKAFQAFIKLSKSNRSAMKRMLHRKGTAGFSEDAGRVLAGFVYSNARQTSKNLHLGEVDRMIEDMRESGREDGEIRTQAIRLREYINNPVEEAHQLRGLLFVHYLGGSIAAALVNMTQPFAVTMPWLSQFGGIRKAGGQMKDALKVAWAKTTGDKALDAALQRATEEGIVAPQEIHQLMAMMQGKGALRSGDGTRLGDAGAAAANLGAKLQHVWGKPFSTAELFNRRVTFVAAYRIAAESPKLGDPYAFAVRAVRETQFLYNKGNRPQWARGALGATLMTFKQYSISYLELLERMWNTGEPGSEERAAARRAVFFALGMILLLGGGGGLPFMEDVEDVVDAVAQRMGYNFSLQQKRRQFLQEAFGKAFGGFLEKGVSGLPGVPIDVAGRLGLQNLIPGTGLLQKKDDHTRDVVEVLGPAGDLARRTLSAADMAAGGRFGDAFAEGAPIAARNVGKAIEMWTTGEYQDRKGYKVLAVDGGDAIAKGIGFQPSAVATVQEGDRAAQEMVSRVKIREAEIAMKWAKGFADGKEELKAEARAELLAWNEKNPDTPIRIKIGDVLKRAHNMKMSRAQRIEKSAPKEVRAEARRLMNGE
jgi:N12 class adenine-specific DNA methylase